MRSKITTRAAAFSLAFVLTASALVALDQLALATPQNYENRINSTLYDPSAEVNGNPIDGAGGTLFVVQVSDIDSTASASDIYLYDQNGNFAQLGVAQGHVGLGLCDRNAVYWQTPHYFAGEGIDANGCETLYDVGAASTNRYTSFVLRRNAQTGQMYGFVGGVQRWISGGYFTDHDQPGVAGEADDTCTDMYVDADSSADTSSRSLTAYVGSSAFYWQQQSGPTKHLLYSQYYTVYRPNGTSTSFGAGLNPYPSGCP